MYPLECLSLYTNDLTIISFMVSILYNNIEGIFYDPKKETLGIFYDPLLPSEEAHIVSSFNIPPPTTTITNTHPRLRNAIWRKI